MFDGVSSVVSIGELGELGELGLVLEEVELLEELELDDEEDEPCELEPEFDDEYDVGAVSPDAAASASSLRACSIWAWWASQREWASAYCFSHFSRCASKPSSHSFVSGSKPSGYL